MSEREDGGPAFPCEGGDLSGLHAHPGMSLRQYYAGLAMQGMMARDSYDPGQKTPEKRARLARIEADALLAELSKKEAK